MKSESQDSVRNLFNLPNDEKIFDDFGCSIIEGIPYHGRIYLTENFICFDSNILGFKSKCVISFQEIKEIKRASTNTIEIILLNSQKKPKYTFGSFTNPNIAYKRIKMICKAYINKINQNNNQEKHSNIDGSNDSKGFNIILSDSEKSDDENEQENTTPKLVSKTQSMNDVKKANTQESVVENKEKEKNSQSDQGEDIQFPPIDESRMYQACKVVINLSPDEFFAKYLGSESETSTVGFYKSLEDHFNVTISNWEKNQKDPNDPNVANEPEGFNRKLNFSLKLVGVPFVNQSEVTKTQKYTIQSNNNPKYIIKGSSSSVGVPYCTYFSIEDTLELYPYMGESKCVLRAYVYNEFTKSTMFKNTIISSTKTEYQKEIDRWINYIKSCGNTVENYQPPKPKKVVSDKPANLIPTHAMEKEKDEEADKNSMYYKVFQIFNEILQKKNMVIMIMLGIVIFGLIIVISNQNRQMRTLNQNIKEIKEMVQTLMKKSSPKIVVHSSSNANESDL